MHTPHAAIAIANSALSGSSAPPPPPPPADGSDRSRLRREPELLRGCGACDDATCCGGICARRGKVLRLIIQRHRPELLVGLVAQAGEFGRELLLGQLDRAQCAARSSARSSSADTRRRSPARGTTCTRSRSSSPRRGARSRRCDARARSVRVGFLQQPVDAVPRPHPLDLGIAVVLVRADRIVERLRQIGLPEHVAAQRDLRRARRLCSGRTGAPACRGRGSAAASARRRRPRRPPNSIFRSRRDRAHQLAAEGGAWRCEVVLAARRTPRARRCRRPAARAARGSRRCRRRCRRRATPAGRCADQVRPAAAARVCSVSPSLQDDDVQRRGLLSAYL